MTKQIETTILANNSKGFSTKSQYFSEFGFTISTQVFDNSTEKFTKTSTKLTNSIDTGISEDKCPIGNWKNVLGCQKCGICKNGFCDSKNGKCDSNLCVNSRIEPPLCNKCIHIYTNYPSCDLKLCSLNSTCYVHNSINENDYQEDFSSNMIISWLVALAIILSISFILNLAFSRKRTIIKYDLEFNTIFSNKSSFNRSDFE
jgi:hypothetical protein